MSTLTATKPDRTERLPEAPFREHVVLSSVGKRFGERQVLRSVDLTVGFGEFLAIVGRSGCGKSTLLRLIAGLESLDDGQIRVEGTEAAGYRSGARMMFQDARLLPWLKVMDNVAIGLPKSERSAAASALDAVGLADRAGEWPAILSGGQKQRVALARALASNPRLLLLDEPLGALDALTRLEMQRLIERLWRDQAFTAILVTHDVEEAVSLADRIVVLEEGRIVEIFENALPRPRSRAAAGFGRIEEQVLARLMR